jgi:hypothetical protein
VQCVTASQTAPGVLADPMLSFFNLFALLSWLTDSPVSAAVRVCANGGDTDEVRER